MASMTWEQAVAWLRAQPGQEALVRACYFDDPLIEAAERFHQSAEWQAVRHLLAGMSGPALDVGAGRGISSYALAKDGWQVTALEPDPSGSVGAGALRALAVASGLPISVVTEYSEGLPFADASFTLVNCRQALHHAKDLRQACREAWRVLRPGGLMLATREHVISCQEDLPAFLASHPLHALYGGENAYLLAEYLAALRDAGFSVEQVIAPFDNPINFSPMSEEELLDVITAPLSRRLGRRVVGTLVSTRHTPGRLAARAVRAIANRVAALPGRAPGRLYSFVARRN